jgi:anthranilate synthase component 1
VIVFDAVKDTITVVTPVRPEPACRAGRAQPRRERLSAIVDALDRRSTRKRPARPRAARGAARPRTPQPRSSRQRSRARRNTSQPATSFRSCCRSASRRRFSLSPFSLYRALRRVNPAPFLFFLDFGGFAVAGSSPEILVRVRDGTVTVRPIAGTMPRGETPHEDKEYEDRLLSDPKERAEHLMLLDLGRNDVGRVAEIGTVTVTDQFFIERYSHVMHIVSNVEGKLSKRHDAVDALAGRASGRHGARRAEGARDGDHRRTGEGKARALCRLGRLISPPPAKWIPASCCAPPW